MCGWQTDVQESFTLLESLNILSPTFCSFTRIIYVLISKLCPQCTVSSTSPLFVFFQLVSPALTVCLAFLSYALFCLSNYLTPVNILQSNTVFRQKVENNRQNREVCRLENSVHRILVSTALFRLGINMLLGWSYHKWMAEMNSFSHLVFSCVSKSLSLTHLKTRAKTRKYQAKIQMNFLHLTNRLYSQIQSFGTQTGYVHTVIRV